MKGAGAGDVALLTGGASGIGRRLAGLLAERGYRVVATDLDLAGLEAAARKDAWPGERVLLRRLDVREPAAFAEAVALAVSAWGRLDLMLNVAGYLRPGYAHEAAPEEIDRHLDVNVKGVIHGTRAAAAQMIPQGHGHVVNIASLAGHVPVAGLSLYSTSKFAVRGFTLAAAHELRPHGIHVSVVCPDAVKTPMVDRQLAYPEAAISFSSDAMLTADEVARKVVDVVLRDRPLEILLPRGRGVLARLVGAWPALGLRIAPWFAEKGAAKRKALLEQAAAGTGPR